MGTYRDIYDPDNLVKAFYRAKGNIKNKYAVDKYELNLLLNVLNTGNELRSHTYKQKGFSEFDINERGKTRHIKSMHMDDRIVQRCACDEVFMPAIVNYLIYDNGASLKGKGVNFARERIETHLRKFYRHYGSNGYILLIDCSKFFDNIRHDILKDLMHDIIPRDCHKFFDYLLEAFKIDVTGFSEEEKNVIYNGVFNSLEYETYKPHPNKNEKKEYLDKSVGIGSHISQIIGVYFLSEIDNYIKIVKGIKYYGRYMDDSYVISNSKEYLLQLRDELIAKYAEYGLTINLKKTQVYRLDREFKWLQVTYTLTESGKIYKHLSHKCIHRFKKKLVKLRIKLDENKITFDEIDQIYRSWMGDKMKYDSKISIMSIRDLYHDLFKEELDKKYRY